MSINGVNSNIDIQKLLKTMKNGQAQKSGLSSKVPAHMTMNGSIFKANTNQVSGNFETTSSNKTASARQTSATESLLKANTAKSVDQASKTGSSQRTDRAEQKNEKEDNAKRIDISNIDFDNLTSCSASELDDLKQQLTEMKDSNVPRYLQNSADKKLNRVKSEISKRASNVSNDNNETQNADGTKKS